MKTLGTILFTLLTTVIFAQNLQVVDQENNEIVHVFEPGERLFITKEGVNAVQPAILLKATNDSVFFKHDSFALTELKKVAKASNVNYAGYFIFSGIEVYGTSAQVVGFSFLFAPGVFNEFETEDIAFSILIAGAFYTYGTITKNAARIVKNFFFRFSNYPNSKFEFVAST